MRLFTAAFAALVLLARLATVHAQSPSAAANGDLSPLSVKITSPLGRTGAVARLRIVARVEASAASALQTVKFFVDDVLLGEDRDGPPYALEWTDENPFEPRALKVVASDASGNTASDSIYLKAFEVVEAAQVSSVLIEASVQDKEGRFINGLTPPAFHLAENGIPQTLDLVTPETMPATYTLLVDSSQSMQRRMDFVRQAAARLTGFLRPQDRVIVAPFSKTLGTVTGPTNDLHTVTEAISSMQFNGGTAIVDSLANVAELVRGLEGRNAVVLVTDGYDEHSTGEIEDALQKVRSAGATLYVIGIGGVAGISLKGERVLRRLSEETGGRVFFPSREDELPAVHELVAADVQKRYLITYTPTNQKTDGTWRQVAVEVDGGYRVKARPGYFAPDPVPIRPAIEFTIQDRDRRFLDVAREDLIVVEDGMEQTVDTFQEAVTPVSLVLALDASGSMKKSVEPARAAARGFVNALKPEDRLAVLTFADRAQFAHDLSTVREWSLEAIDKYEALGGTALYDSLYDSLARLKRVEGRRVVVVVTDGRDENNPGTAPGSVRTRADVSRALKDTETTIFAIGIGPRVDQELLSQLAAESGGEAYFPSDVSTLEEDYRRILENLRRRYVISYSSTNTARDGKWRQVEIRTKDENTSVKSRGGYFAPEK